MNRCVDPHEIQPGDLAAYLDGAASPDVTGHIARCPACAQEVRELAAAKALLRSALHRDRCPSPLTLLEYQSGFLPPAERRQVAAHLRNCAECQQELRNLATLQPTDPVRRAGRQDESPLQRLKTAGKRLLTAVQLPPPRQPALAWRGEEQAARIYQAGDYRVVLSVIPPPVGGGRFQIEGQVLRRDDGPPAAVEGTVQLFRREEVWGRETVDDLGFFALDNVPQGRYTLALEFPQVGIIVEDFAVP